MASVSFSTLPDFDNLMHPAHIHNPFPFHRPVYTHRLSGGPL